MIIPESPSTVLDEAVTRTLDAVQRRELVEGIMLLEKKVQVHQFWLRGYLLLATIYEHSQKAEQAIATIEQGLAICVSSIRLILVRGGRETPEQISNQQAAHINIRNRLERLRRYERVFRHRLAMLQIHCGCFDDAIEQWSAIEEEHCT